MKLSVTAYLYATQYGTIEIPDEIPKNELEDYVANHWEDIDFYPPELDYSNADFEVYVD